jgi:hypothetical protein
MSEHQKIRLDLFCKYVQQYIDALLPHELELKGFEVMVPRLDVVIGTNFIMRVVLRRCSADEKESKK